MKNNQIIIIGALGTILLLYFMLIYRSSGGYTNLSDTTISIRIQEGVNLTSSYSDSLIELLDIYEFETEIKSFSQSKLLVFKMDNTSVEISAPKSGMNQFRSLFSSSFYTYAERKSDLLRLKQNSSQFVSNFRNNSNLPAGENALKITCIEDTNGNDYPVVSVNKLKSIIKSKILSGQKEITVYFTTEEVQTPIVDEPENAGQGTKDVTINGEETQVQDREGQEDEPKIVCKENDVKTILSFEPGLPNLFSWTEQDGYTYDFTLNCSKGDCSDGLSVNKFNVTGGTIEVEASYAEATEKKYTATLVVKCNGKVLKTITKVVKLVCA